MKRLLVYSKDYCGQITIAAISSVTASIATVFIIDILRQIIECISIGNLMQESPEYYFENVNCDRCWHCIELYGCFNDRICWSWVIKEA